MKLIIPRALVCLSLFFLFAKTAIGQDTIIQIDSTRILGVVKCLDSTFIQYKDFGGDETSPMLYISKKKVSLIKYADGTEQVITAPVYYQPKFSFSGSMDVSITGAYLYFGADISPFSSYSGSSTINSYWQNLFSNEKAGGSLQLNKGITQWYGCFVGSTLVLNNRSNISYEFQFAATPYNTIHDGASYPDGTNGTFYMWYMLFNNALQYTYGLDSLNDMQVGVEAGFDVNVMFGYENDAFYSAGKANPDSTRGVNYDASHIGAHFAALGKYFVGKSKKLGVELKAGYSILRAFAPDPRFPHPEIQTPISLNGLFVNLGVIYRLKRAYCADCLTEGL